MKVPPSKPPEKAPDKPLTYDRDRNATKRSVAGAAGGMKGVDYEDDRRPQIGEEIPHTSGSATEGRGGGGAGAAGGGALARLSERGELAPDLGRIMAENDAAPAAPLHTRRKRRFVARDRLTIDKDAPEAKRRHREEEDEEDAPEESLEIFPDSVAATGMGPGVSRAQLFSPDTRPEPGDLSLTDPETIQRALETPLNYAKHAMILAEAFRRSTGATREEAIDYLGRLFVAPRDRTFGRSALKEFGPSSGILDVYPLEVVEHVLLHHPDFLPKVSLGSFFHREGTRADVWRTDTRTPLILDYPEDLKIRGFALRGGGRPGYVFEPDDLLGRYRLTVSTPGRWTCLVSGVSRTGHTTVEAAVVEVTLAPGDVVPPPIEEPYPARDAARVARWPMPGDNLAAEPISEPPRPAAPDTRLSTSELLHQRSLDDERRFRDVDLEVSEEDAPISDRRIASAEPAATAAPASPARIAGETTRERLARVPPAPPQPGRPPREATGESATARALEARAAPPKATTDPQSRSITSSGRVAATSGPSSASAASASGRAQDGETARAEASRMADGGAESGAPTGRSLGAPRSAGPPTEARPPRTASATAATPAGGGEASASGRAPAVSTAGGSPPAPDTPVGAGVGGQAFAPPTGSRTPSDATSRTSASGSLTGTSAGRASSTTAAARDANPSPRLDRRPPDPSQGPRTGPGPRPSAPPPPMATSVTPGRARPRPKPRAAERPAHASAPSDASIDRAEISGAIADAFARLAATPLTPVPVASAPQVPPAAASPAPVIPTPPPSPSRPAVLEVRPQSPLFDDGDTPAATDAGQRATSGSPAPSEPDLEEIDPAEVVTLDPPTARISIRPELADDLHLDPAPSTSSLPIGRPRLTPRAIRRRPSAIDEPGE